jgi:hypothetical protein
MFAKIGPLRRAEDVGRHEVGRELDARERQRERLGERAHEHRLAEPGDAFEERVPSPQHAGDDPVDHLAVADDGLRDLRAQGLDALAEEGHLLANGFGLGHGARHFSSRGRMSWK